MKPVRLGIFETSPGPSGPSRYVQALLNALDPSQWQVTLFVHAAGPYVRGPNCTIVPVCGGLDSLAPVRRGEGGVRGRSCEHLFIGPSPQPSPPHTGERGNGVGAAWRRFAPRPLRLWAGFGRQVVRLAGMIVPQALDLFHTQCTGCEESPLAARLAGVGKILGTFHVTGGYDLELRRSAWPHRTLETLSNHALDGAIAVSEFTRRDWIQRTHLPGKNVWTIHNGVDTEHFSPGLEPWADRAAARVELGLPPDALVVGGVGRLDRIKGFDCLIRAVARLAGVHLALAGSGPMQMQLTQLAAELGIAGRVHFLGFRPDVRRVYQTLDVMAVPSRVEALNYALLEAMAMQLPAVGACAGGIPEAIAEGQTGLLVDGHDPAAWAEALRQLLNSPDMRHRFGLAARARVCAGFAEQTMVRRTLDVYRSMLGQTRSFPSPLYAGERVRVRGSEREISLDSLNSAPIGPSPRPSPLHTGARGEAA